MKPIKIEHGIPISPRNGKSNEFSQVLETMKPGDSIVVQTGERMSVNNAARYRGIVITQRKISDKEIRVWRIK